MAVSDDLFRLGQTVRGGLSDVARAREARDERARRAEETAYNRKRMEEFDALRRPGMQLQSEQAQADLDYMAANRKRVTPARIFKNARGIEQAFWTKQDVPKDAPESQKILQKPMIEAFGDAYNAKVATEGPYTGEYVKKDTGQPLSEEEITADPEKGKVVMAARDAIGRTIRGNKEVLNEQLRFKQITPQQYNAKMKAYLEYENNPVLRIQDIDQKINYLSQFPNSREAKAGLERAMKSRDKQLAILFQKDPQEAQKWAALPGGMGLYEQGSGRYRMFPEEMRRKAAGKDLSPSQQIKQIELKNIQQLLDPNASQEQREQASRNLAGVRGKSDWADALHLVLKSDDLAIMDAPQTLRKKVEAAYRTLVEGPAQVIQQAPPPDYSNINNILNAVRRGEMSREEGRKLYKSFKQPVGQ